MATFIPKAGDRVLVKGDYANLRQYATTTNSKILEAIKKGANATYTGHYVESGYAWYEVKTSTNKGWVRSDVIDVPKDSVKVTSEEMNSLVQKLVKSDEEIFHTSLTVLDKIDKAKKAGKNVSKAEASIKEVMKRLTERQTYLKNSSALKVQTGIRKGYEGLKKKLAGWFGIGEPLSITATVIIGAIVGAGATVALYFALKPRYSESEADLKISKDLEKALSTLTPEQQQAVKDNLEKQVDDAYNRGNTDGTFGSYGTILLYGGLVIGGFFLLNSFKNSK